MAAGVSKRCYECEINSDDDSCGKFDDSTEMCSVEVGGYCVKATLKDENGYALASYILYIIQYNALEGLIIFSSEKVFWNPLSPYPRPGHF